MSPEILGVLIGSGISLVTSGLVTIMQNRHSQKLAKQDKAFEVQTWVRDKKVEVYVHLASFLVGLTIYFDPETKRVDGPSFEKSGKELAAAIERYQGEMALFVPPAINKELMDLRVELYALSSDETAQLVDYSSIQDSVAMKTVIHAKRIFIMMQRDLGIEVPKE